ncbi:MAG: hypothetical protein ACRD2B_13030 [Terriglobia bacterium]
MRNGNWDEKEASYSKASHFRLLLLFLLSAAFLLLAARAQSLYYAQAAGRPAFNTPESVEMGFTNLSNGDLHLEFPRASPSQRGAPTANVRLIYDSRIWEIVDNGTSQSWQPANLSDFGFSSGGWNWAAPDNPDAQVADGRGGCFVARGCEACNACQCA